MFWFSCVYLGFLFSVYYHFSKSFLFLTLMQLRVQLKTALQLYMLHSQFFLTTTRHTNCNKHPGTSAYYYWAALGHTRVGLLLSSIHTTHSVGQALCAVSVLKGLTWFPLACMQHLARFLCETILIRITQPFAQQVKVIHLHLMCTIVSQGKVGI